MKSDECKFCDGECGSAATYAGQVPMPLDGRVRMVDGCIADLVATLNAGTVSTRTAWSCCGHMQRRGRIGLADGRVLVIVSSEDARNPDLLGRLVGHVAEVEEDDE